MKNVFIAVLLVLLILPTVALAQTDSRMTNLGLDNLSKEGNIQLGTKTLPATISSIINVAMGVLGIIVVILILAGGFLWMTAGGSDEKITKAKGLIFGGVIGLAIVLSAYAIAQFVITSLLNATK
jgi:hypothetical protein